ncbi:MULTISPECIES: hypothetical protein [unclassified Streptomyces]|uniref:hypothetical protein n=1 Tax=unclassified Streptomyces TaxID=2593676 RepID=UPI000DADB82C|nr:MULTISPECIES: hypothetical protein [unclassified Streptomyces]PZT77346.1 hypothetical protein DNK56_29535 [Streptomyces sp. AC1-42W]PZT78702.1 hypothetical protein DNK55_03145 [Streptomyces sp. AC1-42T]
MDQERDRVAGLTRVMNDPGAAAMDRFLACRDLTEEGEAAGFNAVIRAAGDPEGTPWYDCSIDRKFSVDSTFSQLAVAVDASHYEVEEKGTAALRVEAFRALVRLADTQYFEDRLGELIDNATIRATLGEIEETIGRGVRALAAGEKQRFDLATQLVDLACAVAPVDGPLAVEPAMSVLRVSASSRTLEHAVTIVHRAGWPEIRGFGEYLTAVGDERVRAEVREALEGSR